MGGCLFFDISTSIALDHRKKTDVRVNVTSDIVRAIMKLRTTKLVKVIIVSGACLTLFAYAFVKPSHYL
jgi:hypothetical protein